MPRTCTVCPHPDRDAIDSALVNGDSFRNIAERFAATPSALFRHRAHVAGVIAKARGAADAVRGDDLLAKVQGLEGEARRIAAKAESIGDLRGALAGVRELTRIVELLAKLRGELRDGAQVNVLVMPEWAALRARVLDALEPHPEARLAVARALGEACA